MKKLILFTFFCSSIYAQVARSVVLTWKDLENPPGTVYHVYRAPQRCDNGSAPPAFVRVASSIAFLTYTDTPVFIGNYCYSVTAFKNELESLFSNYATVEVRPKPPTEAKGEPK